jgi:hypothetical protein
MPLLPRVAVAAVSVISIVPLSSSGSGATAGPSPAAVPESSATFSPFRTYYVSRSGSDAGPGTISKPWRTIQRALRTLERGQRVLVRSGTYPELLTMSRRGTAVAPLGLQAYPGERPVISGRLKITGAHFRVSGLVFVGSRLNARSALVYISGGDNITVSHNEVRNGSMSGIYLGDEEDPADNVSVISNYIHGNGTTNNRDHGIYFDHGSNGVIANNLIAGNLARGIQLYEDANDVIVTHNTVVRNLTGIVIGGSDSSAADANVIVNNIFAYNSRYGISTNWDGPIGRDNVARRNIAFGNGTRDVSTDAGLTLTETIVAHPRFVDPAARNYHLTVSSPAVDRGLAEYSRPRDFDGETRPKGRAPDIGMDELDVRRLQSVTTARDRRD